MLTQVTNFNVILRQFVENDSVRAAASRNDGDTQERQRQKVQLTDEMATWKMSTPPGSCGLFGGVSHTSGTSLLTCSRSWGRPST